MKKSISKIIKTGFLAIIGAFLAASCNDAIFYNVLKDVPPEPATVSGNINSISRYQISGNEYLFLAANGGLRYKKTSESQHGSWKTYPVENLPFKLHHYDYYGDESGQSTHQGQQIIKVLADSDTLYMVTVEYKNDENAGTSAPKKFHIWAAQFTENTEGNIQNSDWTNILETVNANDEILSFGKDETEGLYYTLFSAFSTNAPQNAHRDVFVRTTTVVSLGNVSSKIYKLSGTTKVTDISALEITPVYGDLAAGESVNSDIDSAAYIGNQLYFFNGYACCTNETATENATYAYYAKDNSKILYYTDGVEQKVAFEEDSDGDKSYELNANIASLAVTSDALIIGMGDYTSNSTSLTGGIAKTDLVNGVPGVKTVGFDTNASTQFASTYYLFTLLAVDPSKSELDGIIYTSIGFKGSGTNTAVSYEDIGLWSYLPERGNWNRE